MISPEAIINCRDFLRERMDPDFGLLDKLFADGTVDCRDMDDVRNMSSVIMRNSQLLDCILGRCQIDGLITALRDSDQIHIVNYLTAYGEYSDGFVDCWPLRENEILILDTNHESLVDLLELNDLIGLLHASNVINRNQVDSISSKLSSRTRNGELLETLRRRSLRDYYQTIICLNQSQQSHISELLSNGGVIVRVHVNLDGETITETKSELARNITHLINDSSVDPPNIILGVDSKVIAAKKDPGIVLFIYCKTDEELEQLHEAGGRLRDSVESWFNSLLTESQKISVAALRVSGNEKPSYFKEEEINVGTEIKRHAEDTAESGESEKFESNGQFNISATENNISTQTKKTVHSDDTEKADNCGKKPPKTSVAANERLKLRAISDFDPQHISSRGRFELDDILQKIQSQNERLRREVESSEIGVEIDVETYHSEGVDESDLVGMDNEISIEKQSLTSENITSFASEEAPENIEASYSEEEVTVKNAVVLKMSLSEELLSKRLTVADQENLSSVDGEENVETQSEEEDQQISSSSDPENDTDPNAEQIEQDGQRTKPRKSRNSDQHTYIDPSCKFLMFKKGDEMETMYPVNIGDGDGYWEVRHLNSQRIGLILRNRVVIANHQRSKNETTEVNEAPSETTLRDLPLEMLEKILEKSFLHWILNPSHKQSDIHVIISLGSVDVDWFPLMTRPKFKKRIWKRQKEFYVENNKRSAIIRNNRNYLLQHIQPEEYFIDMLLSLNCITTEQRVKIQRKSSKRDKNAELLCLLRSFDENLSSMFVKCLRRTNQKTVARLLENGGVIIKVQVEDNNESRDFKCTTYVEAKHLLQVVEDIQNRAKKRSHQTDEVISQLKEEGIEILDSQLNKHSIFIWIWCHSHAALQTIQQLYESNKPTDFLQRLANIVPSIPEIIQTKLITIESHEFTKTVAVCPISVNFTKRINVKRKEIVLGVTKLGSEIYILCSASYFPYTNVVRVFENSKPFKKRKKIKLKNVQSPWDIKASEKDKCLYVSDSGDDDSAEDWAWKITRETGDQYEIVKWVTIPERPLTLSVSKDGELLLVSNSSSELLFYRSDGKRHRRIQLPGGIKNPRHAVETSNGNFIILHWWSDDEDKGEDASSEKDGERNWDVCEVSRDGQTVIRRFIPTAEAQQLNDPWYLSLDSDDRVFVADTNNDRVILLNSDLKWNRIICPTETEETKIRNLNRLCYDEEEKQLYVNGRDLISKEGLNVYTLCVK